MNILRISNRLFPDRGGMAKQAFILSKFCSQKGINTFNLTCIPQNKSFIREKSINKHFKIHYLSINAPGFNASFMELLLFTLKFLIFGTIKAFQIVKKERINIIHAHSPPPSGFLAFIVNKILKIPYLYTIHSLDIPIQLLLNIDIKFIAKNAKKIIAVSPGLKKYIQINYDINKVHWLPNGIILPKASLALSLEEKELIINELKLNSFLDKDDFIIIYVGNMIFQQKVKGMIDFLTGFNNFIVKINPDGLKRGIKLLFIGEGSHSHLLEQKIREFELENHVFLLGRRDDVDRILTFSDLLALTSYIEGFPNVILEAMSFKVPCIGTNVGGIKFLIGDTGYLVKPGDIEGIEKKISKFYELSEFERIKLGKSAFDRIKKNFDLEIIGKKLLDLFYL